MIHLLEQLEKAAEDAFRRIGELEKKNRELLEKLTTLEQVCQAKETELEDLRSHSSASQEALDKLEKLETERRSAEGRLQGLLQRYRVRIDQEK